MNATTSRRASSLPPAVVAFLAVAAAALLAACSLAFAGSARADQSCSGSCVASIARASHAAALRGRVSSGGVASTTASYLGVAAVGLGALAIVLSVGGGLLLAAGRRRVPANA